MNISHRGYRLLSTLSPGKAIIDVARTPWLQVSSTLFKINVSADKSKTRGSVSSQPQTFVSATIHFKTSVSAPIAGILTTTRWQSLRKRVIHELKHYYTGFKLLLIETKLASELLRRVFHGHTLTRRERKQLIRTIGDLCRLVPFSIFVIVPFMEFTLPIFLKLFPNMLPSTFKQVARLEEKSRERLQIQLEAATVLQQTMLNMQGNTVHPSPEGLIDCASIVSTNFAIDHLARSELIALCKFLHISSFGPDCYLRTKLQLKFHRLHADDRYLANEGIGALTVQELQAACHERGMSLVDISAERLQSQLQQWIDLHCNKRVSSMVLLLSHACLLLNSNGLVKEGISRPGAQHEAKKNNSVRQPPVWYLSNNLRYDLKECLSIKQFQRSANIQPIGMQSKHLFHLHRSLQTSYKRPQVY